MSIDRSPVLWHPTSVWRRPVDCQYLACEIERAGDQDTGRRIESELTDGSERLLDTFSSLRRNADGTRSIGDHVRRQCLVLPRDRDGDDAPREACEILQECL